MMRRISDGFLNDLTEETGILRGLKERVRSDDTLMLALRNDSIDIYYRGGRILHLARRNGSCSYIAGFDSNYAKPGAPYSIPKVPPTIETSDHCKEWLNAIPVLKEIMNFYLTEQSAKFEREFQQLVAWENNRSKLAAPTEYFITDIEYDTDVKSDDGAVKKARLDMLGLKWLSKDRQNSSSCAPVFIEMKYGTDAFVGKAGIADHIADLNNILSNERTRSSLNQIIAYQFNQLDRLGLVRFNRAKKHSGVVLTDKPEVVFLLSNVNPRSSELSNILKQIQEPTSYKLRFFVANFAGYGMHEACMMDLDTFSDWVGRLTNSKGAD
ncbi:MAG: hypothetical protein Q7T45_27725 [Bradyrhizobium sp.]|uniref:hypothetical protein n=1 Tax=Bradyrhizobium sp. TaxID=376 RepID=UPI00272260A5|nr:hypothetical protein [Bradyrhizobium sp.]MDO8401604.1 hypothetical protein [Bradyrhizobium sp.]